MLVYKQVLQDLGVCVCVLWAQNWRLVWCRSISKILGDLCDGLFDNFSGMDFSGEEAWTENGWRNTKVNYLSFGVALETPQAGESLGINC